jgi:hypothetical protein
MAQSSFILRVQEPFNKCVLQETLALIKAHMTADQAAEIETGMRAIWGKI